MTQRPALDLHQAVTDKIVAAIEAGVGDARLPWQRAGLSNLLPKNAYTKHAYNGINILSLWAEAQVASYPVSLWATYRQWQELGAQVRKGAKAALIVFYKAYEVDPNPDDEADDAIDDHDPDIDDGDDREDRGDDAEPARAVSD